MKASGSDKRSEWGEDNASEGNEDTRDTRDKGREQKMGALERDNKSQMVWYCLYVMQQYTG